MRALLLAEPPGRKSCSTPGCVRARGAVVGACCRASSSEDRSGSTCSPGLHSAPGRFHLAELSLLLLLRILLVAGL